MSRPRDDLSGTPASDDEVSPEPLFPHVLVAVDRTPVGETLLGHLPGLRSLGTGRLTLVHVSGSAFAGESRDALEGMAAPFRALGFEVDTEVRVGLPAPGILAVAAERHPDLILIGTRSNSRVRHVFLGSVALEVLERSSHPVLLQPLQGPSDAEGEGDEEIRLPQLRGPAGAPAAHILLATDFSAAAAPAADLVERFARRGGSRITVVHALEGTGADVPARREEARLRLDVLARRLETAGAAEVETALPTGHPLAVIPEWGHSDTLVVMGTRGRGFLAGILLGSVTRKLAEASRFPLLLVPTPSRHHPSI